MENQISKNKTINAVIGVLILTNVFLLLMVGGFFSDKKSGTAILKDADPNGNEGAVLPIQWGNLGKQLVEAGVIDRQKFEILYQKRGGFGENEKKFLEGENNQNVIMTTQNSGFLLNMFWALGLGNKNPVLEEGPIQNYGDAGRFASTGGWTLAKGNTMDHYSRHAFVPLTPEQQKLVDEVSKNIYRPCCNNPTHFPDCNHGMAMLGLLELMASQGVSEDEMYRAALAVNSYWFPDAYEAIGKYLETNGASLDATDPKIVLGKDLSSVQGYARILTDIAPPERREGGGCGV